MYQTLHDTIREVIKDFFEKMEYRLGDVVCREREVNDKQGDEKKVIEIAILSPDDCLDLIGKQGSTLLLFEHLVRLAIARKIDQPYTYIVDVNNYRKARLHKLTVLAQKVAQKVKITGRAETLIPMTAYERRMVHTHLADDREIETHSVGEAPRRRIIIRLSRQLPF